MIISKTETSISEQIIKLTISDGRIFKILLSDWDNMPFFTSENSEIESFDAREYNATPTTDNYDVDGKYKYLRFLSRKCTIYLSAVAKVAASDMPKRQLYMKLMKLYAEKGEKAGMNKDELSMLCRLVCDEFERRGYIDDYSYALRKAESMRRSKLCGKYKTAQYLYSKGVDKDVIKRITEADEYAEYGEKNMEYMEKLIDKKFRNADFSDRAQLEKAAGYLMRQGYSRNELLFLLDGKKK